MLIKIILKNVLNRYVLELISGTRTNYIRE